MPNWCQNRAVINAPKPVIDEIKEILATERAELLQWMRPIPVDERDNWYDWCVNNWGTKWDIAEAYIGNDADEDEIDFSFETAWAPPVEAFRHWAEQDGRINYRLYYFEEGMGFVGEAQYESEGFYSDEYFSHENDPEEFEERAQAEWGWEPYEEPEPLTEWYEQGVKDKGLDR